MAPRGQVEHVTVQSRPSSLSGLGRSGARGACTCGLASTRTVGTQAGGLWAGGPCTAPGPLLPPPKGRSPPAKRKENFLYEKYHFAAFQGLEHANKKGHVPCTLLLAAHWHTAVFWNNFPIPRVDLGQASLLFPRAICWPVQPLSLSTHSPGFLPTAWPAAGPCTRPPGAYPAGSGLCKLLRNEVAIPVLIVGFREEPRKRNGQKQGSALRR